NRSFDHIFGAYMPREGQTISNLLSKGIVRADGSPGPNLAASQQFTTGAQATYFVGVASASKVPYTLLPAPTLGGAPDAPSATSPPFTGLATAQLAAIE